MISAKRSKLGGLTLLLALILIAALTGTAAGQSTAAEDNYLTFPLNPDFVEYIEGIEEQEDAAVAEADDHRLGFIPPPVKPVTDDRAALFQYFDLPSVYDLRNTGRITGVRNQFAYGSCWAFGAYASMESYLQPAGSYNFSENNMMHLHGFDRGPSGGNQFMAMAYLNRWSGPVLESQDPYGSSPTTGLDPVKHIQNVTFLPPNPTVVKQALMDTGALFAAMHWHDRFLNWASSAYYYNGSFRLNHAVAIVGWDDYYSRNNFNRTPPGDGAWIIKNSWGSGWGESGYFYMSYYDTYALSYVTAFNNAEPATNYNRVYQYDHLGWISTTGSHGQGTIYGANIFTAAEDEALAAVSTYKHHPGSAYTLKIYTGVAAGNPSSGNLVLTQSGTKARPGYHTITLNRKIPLQSGERFSVVFEYNGSGGGNAGIPIESVIRNYSSKATASPGEGFLSRDGTQWDDATSVNSSWSVCIKAFTVDETGDEPACAVEKPAAPGGPVSGYVNEEYHYSTALAACAGGHDLQYRFQWAEGVYSNWGSAPEAVNTWQVAGVFEVRAQARCSINPGQLSLWSDSLTVTISEEEPEEEESEDEDPEEGDPEDEEEPGEDDGSEEDPEPGDDDEESEDEDSGDDEEPGDDDEGSEEDPEPGDDDEESEDGESGDDEEPGDDDEGSEEDPEPGDDDEGSEEEPHILGLSLLPYPVEGGRVNGGGIYRAGNMVRAAAIPHEGYYFVSWTRDGYEVSTEQEYFFVISSSKTLQANFASENHRLNLFALPSEGGVVRGSGEYKHGEAVTVEAVAAGGYSFVNWTRAGEVVSSNSRYDFKITADLDLVANFEKTADITPPPPRPAPFPPPRPSPSDPVVPGTVEPLAPADEADKNGEAVVFSWEKVSGAQSYQIQVINAKDNSIFKEQEVGAVWTVSLKGFPADGSAYKWRVRALNERGWGPWSEYEVFINGEKLLFIYGDLRGSGAVDVNDAALAMRFVLALEALSQEQLAKSDVNGDGRVDILDITLIMQNILGVIDVFPVEQD